MTNSTSKTFDIRNLYPTEEAPNSGAPRKIRATVSERRQMTNEELISTLEKSVSLKKAFNTDKTIGHIARFLHVIRPGGKKVFISHPRLRGGGGVNFNRRNPRNQKVNGDQNASNSNNLKGSETIEASSGLQPYKASCEGETLLLKAMDEENLAPRCYNLIAISRISLIRETYGLPVMSGASMFYFPLEGILKAYMELYKQLVLLINMAKAYNILGSTEGLKTYQVFKTNPETKVKTSETYNINSLKVSLIRSTGDEKEIDSFLQKIDPIVKDITKFEKGSFLSTMMFTPLLFPINEKETLLKGQILSIVDKIILTWTISNQSRSQDGIGKKEIKYKLYQQALANINRLMFPYQKENNKGSSGMPKLPKVNLSKIGFQVSKGIGEVTPAGDNSNVAPKGQTNEAGMKEANAKDISTPKGNKPGTSVTVKKVASPNKGQPSGGSSNTTTTTKTQSEIEADKLQQEFDALTASSGNFFSNFNSSQSGEDKKDKEIEIFNPQDPNGKKKESEKEEDKLKGKFQSPEGSSYTPATQAEIDNNVTNQVSSALAEAMDLVELNFKGYRLAIATAQKYAQVFEAKTFVNAPAGGFAIKRGTNWFFTNLGTHIEELAASDFHPTSEIELKYMGKKFLIDKVFFKIVLPLELIRVQGKMEEVD